MVAQVGWEGKSVLTGWDQGLRVRDVGVGVHLLRLFRGVALLAALRAGAAHVVQFRMIAAAEQVVCHRVAGLDHHSWKAGRSGHDNLPFGS